MSREDAGESQPKQGFSLKRVLPLVVLVAVAAAFVALGGLDLFTLQTVAENREALRAFVTGNYVIAVLAFIGIYSAAIALSLPGGALLTITAGFLFGQIAGGLVAVVAATIGATVLFLIAKTSLGEPLAEKAGARLGRLREGFQENALSYLLFLRLVPAFPFWLVNLAPALLGVPLRTYVLGTFVGIIPGTFAFAFLGAGLDSIIEVQQEAYQECRASAAVPEDCAFELDPGALLTTDLLIAFAALGIVALIPVVVRKLRARKTKSA